MQLYAGTSGYSYKEWKGAFYPEDLPNKQMLHFYSEQLPAVEINNTFYRMPSADMLETWADQVSPGFRFVLKAPRRITHIKPLKDKNDEVGHLLKTTAVLGDKLGAILFQLPPYLRKDTGLLSGFIDLLPKGSRAAFEFRHSSWFDEEVYDLLRGRDLVLCCSDGEQQDLNRLVPTAGWGYLRLRRQDYADAALAQWSEKIQSLDWTLAFSFFKHEDAGTGPRLAKHFMEMAGQG